MWQAKVVVLESDQYKELQAIGAEPFALVLVTAPGVLIGGGMQEPIPFVSMKWEDGGPVVDIHGAGRCTCCTTNNQ